MSRPRTDRYRAARLALLLGLLAALPALAQVAETQGTTSNPLIAPPGSTFTEASLGTVYGGDSSRGYLPSNGCPVPVSRG